MTKTDSPHPPEFSRLVPVDALPTLGKVFKIEATTTERVELADRFDLIALDNLSAVLTLKPLAKGRAIRLTGKLSADAVQSCVITLDPISNHIEHSFEMSFVTDVAHDKDAMGSDVFVSVDEPDPPELVLNNHIDLGEIVAEHMALALDPFPRKSGATFDFVIAEESQAEEEPVKNSPFSVLADVRDRKLS